MFRAAESFCHAVRKNLKFKLLYFQNEECYPAENKQADWNLYFLLCDEDKNPKLRFVMNFSFLWRHVKTKNWRIKQLKYPIVKYRSSERALKSTRPVDLTKWIGFNSFWSFSWRYSLVYWLMLPSLSWSFDGREDTGNEWSMISV